MDAPQPHAASTPSIFVAVEQGRPLGRPLPDRVGVSVVTLADFSGFAAVDVVRD